MRCSRRSAASKARSACACPNSFPQEGEDREFSSKFVATAANQSVPEGRWTAGASLGGKGEFEVMQHQAFGEEPVLGPAPPTSGAQAEQIGEGRGFMLSGASGGKA